jgi:hypothetical protein
MERGSTPTCELARTRELTPQSGTRNLRVPGRVTQLMVQPAFACDWRTDCCQSGSTGGCGEQPQPAASRVGTDNCCAVQTNAPLPASIRARPDQPQPHSSGAPVAATLTPVAPPSDPRGWTPLQRAIGHTVFDQSLTYLRTARLRL